MQSAKSLAEQRRHPRARLQLPARIRWQSPLGMRLEVAETIDVSRDGVLLASREESLAAISRAWIVFPFDASAIGATEPETPAHVVRVERDPGGDYRIALHLQPRRSTARTPVKPERRSYPRLPLCLPIYVRAGEMPWPEETMTRDFSRGGLRFETSHVFTAGENIRARIPWGERAEAGEISGRVVRVEPSESDAAAADYLGGACAGSLCVAVEWTDTAPQAAAKVHG
ncbi:MAG: PilZ domain-containing protein [Terracidiphilus sp.]